MDASEGPTLRQYARGATDQIRTLGEDGSFYCQPTDNDTRKLRESDVAGSDGVLQHVGGAIHQLRTGESLWFQEQIQGEKVAPNAPAPPINSFRYQRIMLLLRDGGHARLRAFGRSLRCGRQFSHNAVSGQLRSHTGAAGSI